MNRKEWQAREGHPPADLLLLYADEELPDTSARAVREHLEGCGPCRDACRQLEAGMARFLDFRDHARIPARAPRVEALRARLEEVEQPQKRSWLERLRAMLHIQTPRQLGFAMGGVSLALTIWVVLFLTSPKQSVYASQLLSDARSASDKLVAQSKVLNQRIRLRQGSLVIERSVHHGRAATLDTAKPKIDAGLQQELSLAQINLDDPLNAGDFAAWRASQRDITDTVRETAESVVITTRVSGAEITEGSLTLSRAGWRPIARSVEVRGEAPIEISELSYDVSDVSARPSGMGIAELAPANRPPASSDVSPDASMTELETSELDLRETLHRMGADVSAASVIWISSGAVEYHVTGRPAVEAAIRARAAQIPYVTEATKAPAGLEERMGTVPETGAYSTTPPLRSVLQAGLGDEQAVDKFLDGLRAHSARVVAEASALDALGRRYPVEAVKALPPVLRTRVNKLAASMLSQLQQDTVDYVKSVSPTLDKAASDLHIVAPSEAVNDAAGCMAWQQSASMAVPQLRQMTTDVGLLLIPERAEKPLVLDGGTLLQDTLKARGFVELHLISTCQLFGSN